ncbi:hypothetical protein AB5J72_49135 [Streptomyces sp. CG1]|uniref:hypothetical protein n=1 Tax=Streptomyces sp. CG1 TaxID=1287523 RepID=UPI0034E233EE
MSRSAHIRLFWAAAVVFAVVYTLACTGLPHFGTPTHPYGTRAAAASLRQRTANVVSSVNFDQRALDTLGEESILFASVLGTIVLLRHARDEGVGRPRAGRVQPTTVGLETPVRSPGIRHGFKGDLAAAVPVRRRSVTGVEHVDELVLLRRVTLSWYTCLTSVHAHEYVDQQSLFSGAHRSGDWSPFDQFDDAETAISCEMPRSSANFLRLSALQVPAPDRQAFASGTVC